MFTTVKNARCAKTQGPGVRFAQVGECGNATASYAIDVQGRLWAWGHNLWGQSGQGDPHANEWPGDPSLPNNTWIVSPQLMAFANGNVPAGFVKVSAGEYSVIAMNEDGELWGCGECYEPSPRLNPRVGNCAAFGLPHDSGVDVFDWKNAGVVNDRRVFFNLTRCAPGYTFKDFMHCYYYTHMIGHDDLLYMMGWNYLGNWGTGSGSSTVKEYRDVPTRVAAVTDTVKAILAPGDFGALGGCITIDNKILVWDSFGGGGGSFVQNYDPEVEYIADITEGLPLNTEFVQLLGDYYLLMVLTAEGDVWARGESELIGRGWYGQDSYYAWVKIAQLSNIKSCGLSQSSPWALDHNNNLYTWGGFGYYETGRPGPGCSGIGHEFPAIATTRKWVSVTCNYYAQVWRGVDIYGRLHAWGTQGWAPHLGIGTARNLATNLWLGIDKAPVWSSCAPVLCDYDSETLVQFPKPYFAPVPIPHER